MKASRGWLGALALGSAALAAAASAVIALPLPSYDLALLAIVLSEKSWLVLALGLVALGLALGERGKSWRRRAALALAVPASIAAAWPLCSAVRLASARGLSLQLGPYLASRIDEEGPGAPDAVREFAVVDGKRLLLDVYRSGRLEHASPALVLVHGGGWSKGSRGDATLVSRRLAELGFSVFDIDYRLAPQPNFRSAVGDVKCALGYLHAHARTDAWHIDPAQIMLLGRSAGGHLALLSAYSKGDPELPPSCPVPDTGVRAVVALYPLVDLTWGYEHPEHPAVFDTRAKTRAFTGAPPTSARALYARLSPNLRVSPSSPPTLLIHGELDQFVNVEHSRRQAEALERAGVPSQALFIPYAQHCFDFVVGGASEQLLEAELLRFLKKVGATE